MGSGSIFCAGSILFGFGGAKAVVRLDRIGESISCGVNIYMESILRLCEPAGTRLNLCLMERNEKACFTLYGLEMIPTRV